MRWAAVAVVVVEFAQVIDGSGGGLVGSVIRKFANFVDVVISLDLRPVSDCRQIRHFKLFLHLTRKSGCSDHPRAAFTSYELWFVERQ